jgi:hypothetical protein
MMEELRRFARSHLTAGKRGDSNRLNHHSISLYLKKCFQTALKTDIVPSVGHRIQDEMPVNVCWLAVQELSEVGKLSINLTYGIALLDL